MNEGQYQHSQHSTCCLARDPSRAVHSQDIQSTFIDADLKSPQSTAPLSDHNSMEAIPPPRSDALDLITAWACVLRALVLDVDAPLWCITYDFGMLIIALVQGWQTHFVSE